MQLPVLLLIDTSPVFTARLEAVCDDLGIHILIADDPGHAARLARSVRVSILILDLDQPPRSALRTMNDVQSRSPCSVVWVMDEAHPDSIARVRAAGADAAFRKRAELNVLAHALTQVLHGESFFPGVNTTPATPATNSMRESLRLQEALHAPDSVS